MNDIAEAVHNAMILYSVHSEDVYLDLLTVANPQEVSYSFFVSRPHMLQEVTYSGREERCNRWVCHAVAEGDRDAAAHVLQQQYPFAPKEVASRRYGPTEATLAFVQDGFVDRYTGNMLIFPPVLRILSIVLPSEFPFHPNWRTDVTHPAYWEIGATVDHPVPVTRGGADDESNWVTTSVARNNAKMNWTLDELGWTLHPAGDVQEWDGLLHWFLEYTAAHPETVINNSIRQWQRAARSATMT